MSEGWRLRLVLPRDLDAILALQRASFEAPQWSEAVWLGMLAQKEVGPARAVFVAERDESVIGFAVASCVRGVAELESVVVAQAERRQGIGRALCLQAVSWAREQGAAVVELEVRVRGAGARALYCSLGFQGRGLRRLYYREPDEDAVVMALRLDV